MYFLGYESVYNDINPKFQNVNLLLQDMNLIFVVADSFFQNINQKCQDVYLLFIILDQLS